MAEQTYTALVTGASSGIGRAFCQRLADRCDRIVAVARREDRLQELRQELSPAVELIPVQADIATVEGVTRCTEAIRQEGPIDLLVNNAGISVFGAYTDADIDLQLDTVRVNVEALMVLTRAALPFMRERGGGAVINVASIGAFLPMRDTVVYGASKAFVQSFSCSLQEEVRRDNIRIQCLCPGMTRTEIHDTPMFEDFDKTRIPEELWMEPTEVVDLSLAALEDDRVIVVTGDTNVAMARGAVQATLDSIQ